jgi:Zn-dependent protease
MGLRTNAWLLKHQAEKQAIAETPAGERVKNRKWIGHLLTTGLTIASFWLLFGLADALLIAGIIVLHELGHAIAMMLSGVGVRTITLVPFFGGMAVPKKMHRNEWQHGFVAWAGPGFSLLPTVALVWYAASSGNQWAAHAAVLFVIVNGLNLLPMPPLDGGVMLNSVLGSVHRMLARIVFGLSVLSILALAIYLKSILFGIVFVFAGLQFIYQAGLKMDRFRHPLNWWQGIVISGALVLTFASYTFLLFHASKLEHKTFAQQANAGYSVDIKTVKRD